MADRFIYDVFLSHNSEDKARVRPFAIRLKEAGLRVWFDEWVIKPGDDIFLAIERGLEDSRTLVLCLSKSALGSDWVKLERNTVLFRDPTNDRRRFVPLLLSDCELPDAIRRYKYVDYRKESGAAFAELLAVCRTEMEEIQPKSHFMSKNRESKGISESDDIILGSHHGWNRSGFKLLHQLSGHRKKITRLNWAPNGIHIASAGQDGMICIWNTETGDLERELVVPHTREPAEWAKMIAWTPAWSHCGRLVACGYGDSIIRLWDLTTCEIVKSLRGHRQKVNNVVWSPDGNTLASCADDSLIMLWDVEREVCIAELVGHINGVNTIAWHPNENILASASLDTEVRLWDTQSCKCIKRLPGHNHMVITVVWSPDGKLLASSSHDGTIRLWNPQTGSQQHILEGHRGPVSCITFSGDGTRLASKGIQYDNRVRIWDTETWDEIANLDEPSSGMWFAGIAYHPKKTMLATLAEYGRTIRIWDLGSSFGVRDRHCAPAVRYCSAKVVLIGESTVGKTTLAHRLVEDRYVKTESTHGMNVWRLYLPLANDGEVEREVLLWDLAGQMDYREIHQLYLDQTALALLLINPQKPDPFSEAADWVNVLNLAVTQEDMTRTVPKLLITTRSDVGGVMISEKKIRRFLQENGFEEWLVTSAKTGENCSDKMNGGNPSKLKQLIAQHIPWDNLPWTSTPHLLAELRNAVLAMLDKQDIRLLRFAELSQRLAQALPGEAFGEADVRTAVTLLANHSLARFLPFGDLVLLQPELINGYAGAIIRAARAHIDEIGCVPEADIYAPDFDFTGIERLNRPDEELLLRALVQTFLDHSLCIAEDTPQGRHLVFPSQYRREKDIPYAPDIFVSYTFSGEFQTVWATLVVRLWYSNEFEHRELWRNAAEFSSAKGHALGLKIDNWQGKGRGTISLYFDKDVPDELKTIFIEYTHRHLARYAYDVIRDRRYVCSDCGTAVKDLDAVRKRLAVGKDFIYCQMCDKKVELTDFIERRLKSDRVARRILTMDEEASHTLDTQALEQILIGHMMAVCGESNQIFRPVAMFDYGIDGEVEFRDDDGNLSGKKIYLQLKSGDFHLRRRKSDGKLVFDIQNVRHLEYWMSQPVDVYLVMRHSNEVGGESDIRWMNVTRYLKGRKRKNSHQIIFDGEKVNMGEVWRLRDQLLFG